MEELNNLFGSNMVNHWISQFLAMGITIFIIPRLYVTSIFGPLLMLFSVALINAFLWDATLFYAIPTSFTSSSLSLFAINGVLFWILVKLLPGIEIDGILPALIAPIIFSITSVFLHNYENSIDWISIISAIFDWLQTLRVSFQQP